MKTLAYNIRSHMAADPALNAASSRRFPLLGLTMLTVLAAATALAQPTPISTPALPAPIPGFTIDQLNQMVISGTPYYSTLRAFQQHGRTSLSASDAAADGMPDAQHYVTTQPLAGSRRFRIVTNTVDANINMTSDVTKEVEPSTIVQQISTTIYSTVATTKYSDPNFPKIWTYTLANLSTAYPGVQLQMPQPNDGWQGDTTAYREAADPYLAANIYTTGVAQKRVYASALVFSGTVNTAPTGIAVWRSDDGGVSWSTPKPVVSSGADGVFYDKPHIVVSWYISTRGNVYETYTRVPQGGNSEIHVARSTDGGLTFPQDSIVATGNVGSPQILVDNTFGYLYCLWLQYLTQSNGFVSRVVARSSTNDGVSWNPESEITSSASGGVGSSLVPPPGIRHNNTRIVSTLVARYNPIARRITATWSAVNNADGSTDIFIATKAAGSAWIVITVPGASTTNDQFEPALDSDRSANNLVSYYSRHTDLNNNTYREYTVMLDGTGANVVRGEEVVSTVDTDPNTSDVNNITPGFVGDYHDVWFSGEYNEWHTSWIGFQSSTSTKFDTFLARIH